MFFMLVCSVPKVKIGPQSTAELARAGYYNARIKKVEMGKINLTKYKKTYRNAFNKATIKNREIFQHEMALREVNNDKSISFLFQ